MSLDLEHAERPLRRDAERNRRRILQAAREVFAERGLSASLDDIAAHAEVGVGTVYRRFPHKQELIDALFEESLNEVAAMLEACLEEPDPWTGVATSLERVLEMNSGVQDAENLAWKLWLVRDGVAPDALLDTYDEERGAAADHNLRVTDATMRFMVPSTRARRVVRDLVVRSSVPVKAARRFVNSGRLSEPFAYRESPIVSAAPRRGSSVPPGDVAPDGPCETGRLRDRLGRGFVALRFGAEDGAAFAVTDVPTELVVAEPGGALAGAYGAAPGDIVLIRPDGHIAAHAAAVTAADRARLVRHAVGGDIAAAAVLAHA